MKRNNPQQGAFDALSEAVRARREAQQAATRNSATRQEPDTLGLEEVASAEAAADVKNPHCPG